MKVIRDALLIRIDNPDVTPGGIYIPKTTEETVQRGEVLEVGRGIITGGKVVPPEVAQGDKIIFRATPMIPIKNASIMIIDITLVF